MSDDQDGCEWVIVSSRYWPTWIVPEKGPLNGCVCVYYIDKFMTNIYFIYFHLPATKQAMCCVLFRFCCRAHMSSTR